MNKLEQKLKEGCQIQINEHKEVFYAELWSKFDDVYHQRECLLSVESKISTLNALFFLEQQIEDLKGDVS